MYIPCWYVARRGIGQIWGRRTSGRATWKKCILGSSIDSTCTQIYKRVNAYKLEHTFAQCEGPVIIPPETFLHYNVCALFILPCLCCCNPERSVWRCFVRLVLLPLFFSSLFSSTSISLIFFYVILLSELAVRYSLLLIFFTDIVLFLPTALHFFLIYVNVKSVLWNKKFCECWNYLLLYMIIWWIIILKSFLKKCYRRAKELFPSLSKTFFPVKI